MNRQYDTSSRYPSLAISSLPPLRFLILSNNLHLITRLFHLFTLEWPVTVLRSHFARHEIVDGLAISTCSVSVTWDEGVILILLVLAMLLLYSRLSSYWVSPMLCAGQGMTNRLAYNSLGEPEGICNGIRESLASLPCWSVAWQAFPLYSGPYCTLMCYLDMQ